MLLLFRVVFVADRSRFEDARRKNQVYFPHYNLDALKFQEGSQNASTFSEYGLFDVDSPKEGVFFAFTLSQSDKTGVF